MVVEDNEVKLVDPAQTDKAPIKLTFGLDFNKADLYLDGQTQLKDVKCTAWNMTEQKIIEGESTGKPDSLDDKQGYLKGKDIAFSKDTHEMHLTWTIG